MAYTSFTPLQNQLNSIAEYAALKTEYGCAEDVRTIYEKLRAAVDAAAKSIKELEPDADMAAKEPDGYEAIQALCEGGNPVLPVNNLKEKMTGAVLGRFAGCLLGVPVEMYSIQQMKDIAGYCGMEFPPKEYWRMVDRPWSKQYGVDERVKYSREGMNGVSVDDDITYTILGLLIVEKYGFHFTTENVGEFWKDYLPCACTAEHVALKNLMKGLPASQTAEIENPYCQWIGADIRSDGFAFAAAGNPHLAARMGYYDAYLSHRRNGIYGEMFFAAAEAAAFVTDDPFEAIRMGLREIPKECALHKDIEWALETAPSIHNYEEARAAVDEHFAGMSVVHTNNNACLVVFGLNLGHGDYTEAISQVVAMGMDNDCTGATTGCIMGAIVGREGIDERWISRFHDTVRTYIRNAESLSIADVIDRFVTLATNQPK